MCTIYSNALLSYAVFPYYVLAWSMRILNAEFATHDTEGRKNSKG